MFSIKDQVVNALGFMAQSLHLTLPLPLESSHRQYINEEHGCVPIKLYLWTLKAKFHVIFTYPQIVFFF